MVLCGSGANDRAVLTAFQESKSPPRRLSSQEPSRQLGNNLDVFKLSCISIDLDFEKFELEFWYFLLWFEIGVLMFMVDTIYQYIYYTGVLLWCCNALWVITTLCTCSLHCASLQKRSSAGEIPSTVMCTSKFLKRTPPPIWFLSRSARNLIHCAIGILYENEEGWWTMTLVNI